MIIALLICLSVCLLYFIKKRVIKTAALKGENERIQAEITVLENYYENIEKEIETTRKYRHDLKKHIHLLEEILHYEKQTREKDSLENAVLVKETKRRETARKNIKPEGADSKTPAFPPEKPMENICADVKNKIYCDNIFMITICLLKKKQCAEKYIPFLYDVFLPYPLPMEGMEISSLMQNLLDNAIEANEQIKNVNEREIVMDIRQSRRGWRLNLRNACPQLKEIDFRTWKEDKNNHGYGVQIIQEIVEKYHGTIEYITEKDGRHMTVKIFFPEETNK